MGNKVVKIITYEREQWRTDPPEVLAGGGRGVMRPPGD